MRTDIDGRFAVLGYNRYTNTGEKSVPSGRRAETQCMRYRGLWSCHGDDLTPSILEDHNFAVHHFSSIQTLNLRWIQRVQFYLDRIHQHAQRNKMSLYQTCRFSMNDRPRTTSKWCSSERYTVCEVDTAESSRSPWSLRTFNLIGQIPIL